MTEALTFWCTVTGDIEDQADHQTVRINCMINTGMGELQKHLQTYRVFCDLACFQEFCRVGKGKDVKLRGWILRILVSESRQKNCVEQFSTYVQLENRERLGNKERGKWYRCCGHCIQCLRGSPPVATSLKTWLSGPHRIESPVPQISWARRSQWWLATVRRLTTDCAPTMARRPLAADEREVDKRVGAAVQTGQ